MDHMINTVEVSDDEWEHAAIEQLRDDVRGYPGGARGFVTANRERLGIAYDAFNNNLNHAGKISYRTFSRAVAILGFTPDQYDQRIMARLEAQRRRGV